MNQILLKKGREKPLLRRHPWVFSGAVASVQGDPQPGETIAVLDSMGQFLAWGAYSPHSQIRTRIWSWEENDTIDIAFLKTKIQAAINLREAWINPQITNACRLVHAESDYLPGFIADRYDRSIVLQILSAGAERWREEIISILADLLQPEAIHERSDVAVRELEGLQLRRGTLFGKLPPQPMLIKENGLNFLVNLESGQKTGFYLDQRDNRLFCQQIAQDKSILNCFAFTGGFTAYALAGGAKSVVSIDSSKEALQLAQDNITANQLPDEKCEWIVGDVFEELRTLRDQARQFDMVVLDPPKFAPTAAQAKKAARGYKDINLYGFKLLKPGGLLMTFSCSGGIDPGFFQKIVADAALDAGVSAQVLYRLTQAPDHPTNLAFPEGTYLKGLVVRVGD